MRGFVKGDRVQAKYKDNAFYPGIIEGRCPRGPDWETGDGDTYLVRWDEPDNNPETPRVSEIHESDIKPLNK